jgi:hypothetical protein
MSDPIDAGDERRLRDALHAEVEALPLRLRPEDLGRRWEARSRGRIVRRLRLVAAVLVVAVVGLATAWSLVWSIGTHGTSAVPLTPPPAGPIVAGPVSAGPAFANGPGLSTGRATLSITQPEAATSSFEVRCSWSMTGHVLGLLIGKQAIGSDFPFLRWKVAPGPKYQIELVEPDQTTFIGSDSDYSSQASADGHSGSITFTNLVLNSGDPSTPPRRSGMFTWTCDPASSLGNPAPSLPAPTEDEHGVPTLWIIHNGKPARQALIGCPIDLRTPIYSSAASCATSDWWALLPSLNSALEVASGDSLAFALDGWTVTLAAVGAAQSSSPPGTSGNPMFDLRPTLGNGAVAFSPPGSGVWYVHFIVDASKDDGSSLHAEYSYAIKVP